MVLITHDHYDHLEAATMRELAQKAKRFIVPLGVGARLQSWGVPKEKITELGWGEAIQVGAVKLTAETAIHYSSRWFNDRDKTLWASYVLQSPQYQIFWSGDSGYGKHFAEIGEKYQFFDFAFIEIDAANPGWPNTHMFAEQAVQTAKDLKANTFIPIHWGVFDLGGMPWDYSIKRVTQSSQQQQVTLHTPKIGEKYQPEHYQFEAWWQTP